MKELNPSDVCASLHVALRKACDSTVTSALWNLIHVLDDDVMHAWIEVGKAIVEELNAGSVPKEALRSVIYRKTPNLHRQAHHAYRAIRLLVEMFDEKDLEAAVSFL